MPDDYSTIVGVSGASLPIPTTSVDSGWPSQWWKIICYTPGLSLRLYLPRRALYRDESWTDKNFYIRGSNPPISRREEYLTGTLEKRKSNLIRKERFE